MRYIVVIVLTLCQFTALPFLSMVAANSARQQINSAEHSGDQARNAHNVTTVFKTVAM